MHIQRFALAAMLQSLAVEAYAYVGPASIGGFAALIGVAVAILLTIWLLIALPIKILYRKYRLKKTRPEQK